MAKAKSKGRSVFRIEIFPEAEATLLDVTSTLGITQIALCSRIVEWFSEQPDEVKMQILGLFPDLVKEDAVTTILKRMAS